MKKASIILLLFLSLNNLSAQNPFFQWAKGMGGVSEDAGNSMKVDPSGNVVSAGYFHGTTDLDPGSGTFNLTSNGWADIFISKLDASGNFLWGRSIGGTDFDNGLSVTVDASENVYLTGYYKGTVDFDPGGGIYNLTSTGKADYFILKLDPAGNFLWVKNIGGVDDDYSYSISIDPFGYIYTTGYFQNTVDFDPGAGIYNLTAVGTFDIFISRLDPAGNLSWAKQLGSGSAFYNSVFYNQCSVAFDPLGNVYVAGVFLNTGDFDPGPGVYNLVSAGGSDIFITKLSASGNFVWAKRMGGPTDDDCFCMAIDANGNVCTSGNFTGTADFDPGGANYSLTSTAGNDVFISKLSPSGSFVWAKSIGGVTADWGNAITIDASGNIYTTGYFGGTVDFDPGSGTSYLSSAGNYDVFLSKLDPLGNFLFAINLGGNGTDMATGLFVDGYEDIYIEGIYTGTANFDPGPGVFNLTSAGGTDVFVVKLSQHCLPLVSITASPSGPICPGTSVSFNANPVNGGAAPSYQWKVNGTNTGPNSSTFTSNSLSSGDVVSVTLTSNAACALITSATSNTITITVSAQVVPAVSISALPAGNICAGATVNFTAVPTSGGSSPIYQWKVNGINTGSNAPTFSSNSLNNNDVVTVVMTSNATCASPATGLSNTIIMAVNPLLTPLVNISALPSGAVCQGTPVSFTATPVNGGTSPSYQWKINGINVGLNSPFFTTNSLSSSDIVTVVMNSIAICATPAVAISNAVSIIVNPLVTPSVNITASPSGAICPGTPVNFTATTVNSGPSPFYQWKVNGMNAGTNVSTFTSNSLNNGDVVTVVMFSNANCVSQISATSNSVVMTVNPLLAPAVSISAAPLGPVCAGTPVNFTAIPINGGTTPSYQWKINGVNAGTNASSFNTASLSNGDIVTVVMSSNATCASPAMATSNAVTINVNPLLIPSVNVTASPSGAVCPGTLVSFTATAVNGGTTPLYQWKINGVNAGTNVSSFSSNTLSNGDVVTVVVTSNANCATPSTATSNLITINVSPQLVPVVNIAALPSGAVCDGTTVSFTATPSNGGPSPSYQWKVNAVNAGINSSTFSLNSFANGDIVTVVMNSNASCASPTIATSNAVTLAVNPLLTPAVNISASPSGAVCAGTTVSFIAMPVNGGTTPSYQWKVNGVNAGTNSSSFITASLTNGSIVTVVMNSNETCASPAVATSNTITITVNPILTPAVNIANSPSGAVCPGTQVNFTATAVNGGITPSYQWKVNGVNTGTNAPTFTSNSLMNGDVVTVTLISNAICATPAIVTSTPVTMTVNLLLVPDVNIAVSPLGAVCSGTPLIFTATPLNGGSSPSYQWKVNGVNAGANAPTFTSSSLNNADIVTVVMNSNAGCASPTTALSNAVAMIVNPLLTPSVNISAVPAGAICQGTPVIFTATPTNGGTTPSYQWKVNGVNAGTNSSTFTTTSLNNADIVTVVMNSNETCVSPAMATAPGITMNVNPLLTPSVNVTASPSGAVCPGTLVSFTATAVNGGITPSYQWKVNAVNVGTNSSTFTTTALSNADVVTVVMISNENCVAPATAISNQVIVVVNPQLAPAVNISSIPAGAICPGTSVSFTATPANGGSSPIYQWKMNGINVGTNFPNYTNSTLTNGDIVTVDMVSSIACASPASANSNPLTITVNPAVTPIVTIAALPSGSVCPGTAVNFIATAVNGGTAPTYQWKVNGVNVGTNLSSYNSISFVNGDIITVVMNSNANCASPVSASSNAFTMVVNPIVIPLANILASPSGAICAGTPVSFSATPVNGGSAPSYQWKVNGVAAGTNASSFTSNSLNNGDIVNIVLTSNANCATPTIAISNNITIAVNPQLVPAVSITGSTSGAICPGTAVSFTATPVNGGGSPSYQWKINGVNTGTNSPAFSSSTFMNGDIVTVVMSSNATCAVPAIALSNGITVNVNPTVIPSVSIASFPSGAVCPGSSVSFTAATINGGSTPSFQWKVNGVNVGINTPGFASSTLANGDVVTVVMNSNANCAAPAIVMSNAVTVAVNSSVTPAVTIGSIPSGAVCPGTSVSFTATPVNGGASPVYQWKVNSLNVGTNASTYSTTGLTNADIVSVVMTSNAICPTAATVTSNTVTMNVSTQLVPSVSIGAVPSGAVCPGTPFSFTATATNCGATPLYQWKINGLNAGTNASTFNSSSLSNGDIVTVMMTSSIACASPASVISNGVSVAFNPIVTPLVAIAAATTGAVCPGTPLSFSATTTNGGSSPLYQWKVNGVNAGTNVPNFISNSLSNGDIVTVVMTSNATCPSQATAVSNPVTVAVNPPLAASVSISPIQAGPVCSGSPVSFTATPVNGGTVPSFLWQVNGMTAGTNSPVLVLNKFNDGDVIRSYMASNAGCATPLPAPSNSITLKIDYALCPTHFFMPSGFTPNNDGRNDVCKPILAGKVINYKFTVYNRWGQRVFETSDVNKGWDGRLSGVNSDSNVFVWVCSFQFLGQSIEDKKGTVVLIR